MQNNNSKLTTEPTLAADEVGMFADTLKWLGQPPAVAEYAPSGISQRLVAYWFLGLDGNYKCVERRYGSFEAKMGGVKIKDLPEFMFHARQYRTKVIYLAGVQPGLYEGQRPGDLFLVPTFIPLVTPADPAEPPQDFKQIWDTLQTRRGAPDVDTHALTVKLENLFLNVRDAKKVPRNLVNKLRKMFGGKFPCDDHVAAYEWSGGYLYVSHSYGYNLDEIAGFAAKHHLRVTTSKMWSWHLPGQSILIEWWIPASSVPVRR